jgi:hypothetical protein
MPETEKYEALTGWSHPASVCHNSSRMGTMAAHRADVASKATTTLKESMAASQLGKCKIERLKLRVLALNPAQRHDVLQI